MPVTSSNSLRPILLAASALLLSSVIATPGLAQDGPVCDEYHLQLCGGDDPVEYVRTEDNGVAPAEVVKACKKHASLQRTRSRCYGTSQALPAERAARVITACGEATGTDDALVSCLVSAKKIKGQQARAVKACDGISTSDADLNACLGMLVDLDYFAVADTLEACIASTSLTASIPRCMSAARRLDRDHAEIVTACGKGYSSDTSRINCIKETASR